MATPELTLHLPEVEESDLLGDVLLEDIADPSHRKRWEILALSNRALAREILRRAYSASGGNPEVQKTIIDEITYVYAALSAAAIRQSGIITPIDVVVDEGLRPSI